MFEAALKERIPSSSWKTYVRNLLTSKENDWLFIKPRKKSPNKKTKVM